MTNKTREDNKRLRQENDLLRDEILQFKQEAHDAKSKPQVSSRIETYAPPSQSRPQTSEPKPQESRDSSYVAKPNYFPGVNSSLPKSVPTNTYSRDPPAAHTYEYRQ